MQLNTIYIKNTPVPHIFYSTYTVYVCENIKNDLEGHTKFVREVTSESGEWELGLEEIKDVGSFCNATFI